MGSNIPSQSNTSPISPPYPNGGGHRRMLSNSSSRSGVSLDSFTSKIPKPAIRRSATNSVDQMELSKSIKSPPQHPSPNSRIPRPPLPKMDSKDSISGSKTSNNPPQKSKPSNSNNVLAGGKSPKLAIGQKVFVPKHTYIGMVRYLGPTKFKEGVWAGIELDVEGAGNNDGSVDGVVYFKCPPKTGIFIDYRKVRPIEDIKSVKTPRSSAQAAKGLNRSLKDTLGESTLSTFATITQDNHLGINGSFQPMSIPKTSTIYKVDKLANPELSPISRISYQRSRADSMGIDNPEDFKENGVVSYQEIEALKTKLALLKKHNNLLTIRLNKKHANSEATRLLMTEYLDKTQNSNRNSLSPKSQNIDQHAISLLQSKEEDISELKRRIEKADQDMILLKEAFELKNNSHSDSKDDELNLAIKEKNEEIDGLQLSINELNSLLFSRDELIVEIRSELDELKSQLEIQANDSSFLTENASRLAEALEELEQLKEQSGQEIQALTNRIDELEQKLFSESQRYEILEASEKESQSKLVAAQEEVFSLKFKLEELEIQNITLEELVRKAENDSKQAAILNEREIKLLMSENDRLNSRIIAIEQDDLRSPDQKEMLALHRETEARIKLLEMENDEMNDLLTNFDTGSSYKENSSTTQDSDNENSDLVRELRARNSSLLEEMEALKTATNALKASLSKTEPSRNRGDSIDASKSVIYRLENEITSLKARVQGLENELEDSFNELEQLHNKNDNHDSISEDGSLERQLRETIKSLQDKELDYTRQLANAEAEMKSTNELCDNVVLENSDLEQQIEEKNEQIDRLSELVKKRDFKLESLMKALEEEGTRSEQMKKVFDLTVSYEKREHEQIRELEGLEKQLAYSNKRIDALEEENIRLASDINFLLTEAKDLPDDKESTSDLLDDIDMEAINALEDEDPICVHCLNSGHNSKDCKSDLPKASGDSELDDLLEGYDEDDLNEEELDENVCWSCLKPGHSGEDCITDDVIF